MADIKTGVITKTARNVDFTGAAMTALSEYEVLVGVPEETTERDNDDGSEGPITNAAIAYIQDQGAPERNIPQREFMRPGVENAQDPIIAQLERGLRAALADNMEGVLKSWEGAGIAAQRGIQNAIKEGIPPPLSERTLQARARRGRTGATLELERREMGEAPSIDYATPLMDTGELLQSIKYVVRDKNERR